MKRPVLKSSAFVVVMSLLYLGFWPVKIDPIAWEPPVLNESGWAPTADLKGATRVPLADGHGPEDIDLDDQGRIYGGLQDGRIMRFTGAKSELFADTGGRPLGLHWDAAGNLLVADADKGLLRISPAAKIEVLATECGGRALKFTDDLSVTDDGKIWFTDATTRFSQGDWKSDILESRASGRLCVFDPATGKADEVIRGMYFANGVAVDPAQQFVLINETTRYRVSKRWIAGEKSGTTEVIIDNLPGFPDGISAGSGGVYWIAIVNPRNAIVDATAGSPFLRKVISRLPDALQPSPEKTARMLGIDAGGKVVHHLFDPAGEAIALVTSVQERNGRLYLGSLTDTAFAHLPRPR